MYANEAKEKQKHIGSEPKISVIIPVYNTALYLSQCLDSVVTQSLQDIEIICVDDGSIDRSVEILKDYKGRDQRISILLQSNSGAGVARNYAIQNSTGEFIAFMDSDDWYPENNILEKLYCGAKNNDVLICGGSMSLYYIEDESIRTDFQGLDSGYVFHDNKILSFTEYQFDYGFTRYIYQRRFILENNIFFPGYKSQEDPVFFVKALVAAGKFYAITDVVYRYRLKKEFVKKYSVQAAVDTLKSMTEIIEIAKSNDFYDLYQRIMKRMNWFLSQFKDIHSLEYYYQLLNLRQSLDQHPDHEKINKKYVDFLEKRVFNQKIAGLTDKKSNTAVAKKDISLLNQKHGIYLVKALIGFPWYNYKIYRCIFGNPVNKITLKSLLKAYAFFPYFVVKSYLGLVK
jgi:glycosyltransferase involved in cell wall biosynthesis